MLLFLRVFKGFPRGAAPAGACRSATAGGGS